MKILFGRVKELGQNPTKPEAIDKHPAFSKGNFCPTLSKTEKMAAENVRREYKGHLQKLPKLRLGSYTIKVN